MNARLNARPSLKRKRSESASEVTDLREIMSADEHIKSLFPSGLCSDITFELCDGTTMALHRNVLCKCKGFRNLFEARGVSLDLYNHLHGREAGADVEPQTEEDIIVFEDESPKAMRGIVMFVYGFSITDWLCQVKPDCGEVVACHDLSYNYGVTGLPQLIASRMKTWMTKIIAQDGMIDERWWPLFRRIYDNGSSVDYAFLRSAVLGACRSNTVALVTNEGLRANLAGCPGMALDLLLTGGLDGEGYKVE